MCRGWLLVVGLHPQDGFHVLQRQDVSRNRKTCQEAVGLGEVVDEERYGHLRDVGDFEENVALLRLIVERALGCCWLPDTIRSQLRAFDHRLITTGPPVRVPLLRLSRPDQAWIEKAIAEDVARGQLEKGQCLLVFQPFQPRHHPATKQSSADAVS